MAQVERQILNISYSRLLLGDDSHFHRKLVSSVNGSYELSGKPVEWFCMQHLTEKEYTELDNAIQEELRLLKKRDPDGLAPLKSDISRQIHDYIRYIKHRWYYELYCITCKRVIARQYCITCKRVIARQHKRRARSSLAWAEDFYKPYLCSCGACNFLTDEDISLQEIQVELRIFRDGLHRLGQKATPKDVAPLGVNIDMNKIQNEIVLGRKTRAVYREQYEEWGDKSTWKCTVCGIAYNGRNGRFDKHHTNYITGERILVCKSCHGKIHTRDYEPYSQYKPEIDRATFRKIRMLITAGKGRLGKGEVDKG